MSITAVKEGTVFTNRDDAFVVRPACEEKNGGHWFCVTHSEGFANQLQKDFHVNKGSHVLAWICHTHGPEEP